MRNIHTHKEYIAVDDLARSAELVVAIARLAATPGEGQVTKTSRIVMRSIVTSAGLACCVSRGVLVSFE